MAVRRLFLNLFRKQRVERELEDEVRSFVALSADEKMSSGMSAEQARRAALIECGGVEQVKESVREVRAGALLEQCWQDVRFGLRMLRKDPGFTAVAVLTIALGIGVNAGIFTLINTVSMHPLQVADAPRVLSVYQTFRGDPERMVHGESSFFSYPEYLEYRDGNNVFLGLMAYTPMVSGTFTTSGRRVPGQLTSCNYFDVLQAPLAMGRGFAAAECAAEGGSAVVVLSDAAWRTEFAADPAILGKTVRINRQALQVIGVAAPTFTGTDLVAATFWVPVTMQHALEGGAASHLRDDNLSWLVMMGRLKAGVSVKEARAQLSVIASRIDQRHPGRTTKLAVSTATLLGTPEAQKLVLGVGTVLLIAVGLVLLVVCANVANLMLARATGRRREFAVRLAVGAARGRLVRQLLLESLLLSGLGGALGLVVAVWSAKTAVLLILQNLPAEAPALAVHVAPDFRVFAYTFALALLTGLIFGLVPARQATRTDVHDELKSGSGERETEHGRHNVLRHVLVAAQIGLCTLLLISAGLLVRGLSRAQRRDPGFQMDHVTVATFNLTAEGYKPERAAAFHRQVEERLRSMPGVDGVASATLTQIDGGRRSETFELPGRGERNLNFNEVSPDYFSLLGIPLVRGRGFTPAEAAAGAAVVIVTESTARRLWPGEEPIGKHLLVKRALVSPPPVTDPAGKSGPTSTTRDLEVVGVARDSDTVHLGRADEPYVYLLAGPADQLRKELLVHSRSEFAATADAIRDAAREADADATVQIAPLHDNLELFFAPSRIGIGFASLMGGLALVISAIGIYGTVAYSVGKRTREIGIRIALGANSREVLRIVLRQILRPLVIGTTAGLLASFAASRLLTVLLFGMSPFDIRAYAAVVAFLSAVALLASYLPARRALKVDPMIAIRHE